MANYDAAIRKALPSQEDLKRHREHCSADPGRLAAIGRACGQQVRVRRDSDQYALYTVSEVVKEQPDGVVRMGLAGRRRLGTDAEFEAVVEAQVPNPTLTQRDAKKRGEFIERLEDDGRQTGLIAIAPHGGDIELHTDQQAERVASRLEAEALTVSSWRCKGWKRDGGAFDRWHITSTDLNEASFPLLASVISRGFSYAVAFHGFDGSDTLRGDILIGGTADALKPELLSEIQGAVGAGVEVRIPGPDEKFGGDDPRNIVNRLAAGGAGGIQIEQRLAARTSHWRAIADTVARVYAARLRSPAA
jgi:phage replication-related protein YjqB (UPF0714/DUF867 family)